MFNNDRGAWSAVAILMAMVLSACSGSEAGASSGASSARSKGEKLEMEISWLPAKNPKIKWEPQGARVALSQATLLRDDTLASASEWVLLDAKQQAVRIPRGYFIKYLLASGVQDACPIESADLSKCVVFVGSDRTALLADIAQGIAARISLRARPAPLTPEEEQRKEVGDLVASAAMLPGAPVRYEWLPQRPKFEGKYDFRQERLSKGAIVIDKIEASPVWSILDAKQQPVPVQRGQFVNFLTDNGLENTQPTTPDQLRASVVFVGTGDVAMFLDVDKRAICRVDASADK